MPSDRGTTMQRGSTASADQSSWAEPTAPGSRKLPGVRRERKPALAALAVVLILGGALAVGYVMTQGSKQVGAIQVTHQIGEGQQIAQSDMQEVNVPAKGGLSYVPWSEAAQVSRSFAATTIPAGTLLTQNMASAANTETNGKDVIGLALKDGQLPAGLTAGDHVNIYEVSDATEACPGAPGSLLSLNAVVLDVSTPSATSSSAVADVEVALTPSTAGAVACNASNGILSVVIAPGSFLPQGSGATSGTGNGTTGTGSSGATPSQQSSGSGPGAG